MACRYILSPTYRPDMSPSERTHKVIAIVNKMVSMMEGVIQVSNTIFPFLMYMDCRIEHNISFFLSQCVRLPLAWLCSFIMLLFHTDILLVKCLNCVLFNSPHSLYSYTSTSVVVVRCVYTCLYMCVSCSFPQSSLLNQSVLLSDVCLSVLNARGVMPAVAQHIVFTKHELAWRYHWSLELEIIRKVSLSVLICWQSFKQ